MAYCCDEDGPIISTKFGVNAETGPDTQSDNDWSDHQEHNGGDEGGVTNIWNFDVTHDCG